MSKAQACLDANAPRRRDENYLLHVIKWLNDHDPNGSGVLNRPDDTILFELTDGSKLILNLTTGDLSITH